MEIKSIAPAPANDLLKKERVMKALRSLVSEQAFDISGDSLKNTPEDKIIEMDRWLFWGGFRFCPWHI